MAAYYPDATAKEVSSLCSSSIRESPVLRKGCAAARLDAARENSRVRGSRVHRGAARDGQARAHRPWPRQLEPAL
eukprot:3308808-Rhodomonas_salina.2